MSDNAPTAEGEKKHTASELSQALSGTAGQRAEEEKTLHLVFAPGVRADVVFTGLWSGRLVRSAFNAISKAYRRRRHKLIGTGETIKTRPESMVETTDVVKPKEVIGDGR